LAMGERWAEHLLGLRHHCLSKTSFHGWPPSYSCNVALLGFYSRRGSKLSLILLMLLFGPGLEPWDRYIQWFQSEPLLAFILVHLLLLVLQMRSNEVLTWGMNY
jgi:hypothetical protein